MRFETWSKRPTAIDELCAVIAGGANLSEWCRTIDFSFNAVRTWIQCDPTRELLYIGAREQRADRLFDQLEQLVNEPMPTVDGRVDPGAVQNRRLQVDTLKWAASKLNRRLYDESISIDQKVNGVMSHELSPKHLSDEALENIIRRSRGLAPDAVITNDLLDEIQLKAAQQLVRVSNKMAESRGLHRPQLTYQPQPANPKPAER